RRHFQECRLSADVSLLERTKGPSRIKSGQSFRVAYAVRFSDSDRDAICVSDDLVEVIYEESSARLGSIHGAGGLSRIDVLSLHPHQAPVCYERQAH